MAKSLIEQLGFGKNDVVVIVSLEELGYCHAANSAIYELLRDGKANSASLMIPAPWARVAAADHRGENVGVSLTIVSELDRYRWGPITQAPSLLDGDGAFPRTVDDVWEHADVDEVRREWRAQIERAVLWGFDVTHLVMHAEAIEARPEFFDVYLDLAEDFRLPVRLLGQEAERLAGFPLRALTSERGVIFPEATIPLERLGGDHDEVESSIRALRPGLYEITCRVAKDTDELRAMTPDWRQRADAYELLRRIDWSGLAIATMNYRPLVRLMREGPF